MYVCIYFSHFIWYLFRRFLDRKRRNDLFCIFLAYTTDIPKLSYPVTSFSVSVVISQRSQSKADVILVFIKRLGPSS